MSICKRFIIMFFVFLLVLTFILVSLKAEAIVGENVSLHPSTRSINPNDVTATVLSESRPIASELFGPIGPTPAPSSAFNAYVHPRIVNSASDWDELLERYAVDENFLRIGSWSRHHRLFTLSKGPYSIFITELNNITDDGTTNLYDTNEDYSSITDDQKNRIKPLADSQNMISELKSGALFMCTFWTAVEEKRVELYGEEERFLKEGTKQKCIKAVVAWAKVMLAHRAYYCDPMCPTSKNENTGYLWNYHLRWEVQNDWFTSSFGLGLSYDVLYNDLSEEERKVIRSAIALLVMKRFSWGNSETSDRLSPNAVIHPHRIFSNWAMYHSNLYLANLAIEKETGFDVTTTKILENEGEQGFNEGLNTRFTAMIEAYLAHSIYPDGSTFEDGYTYFIALREGTLALVAAHRRGVKTIDTPRFRNLIHNAVQMYEPWMCGEIIGHASGGGLGYPAHVGLFRYAYPRSALTTMLWKQRMTPAFTNQNPCRINWHQNMVQLSILGGEHINNAQSVEFLDAFHKELVPKSFYSPRRGLLIARTSHDEDALYVHFDARPDAFFPGHENADRGVVTLSAFKKTWLTELSWRENVDSRRHSILHVDGLAEDEKAPCARMMKVLDNGAVVLAAANLTYSYNVQWARNWPYQNPPYQFIVRYNSSGQSEKVYVTYTEREYGDPRDFGWPEGDDGADLGLARPGANLHGDPDLGFLGQWTWKRDYRELPLIYGVRSIALVRESGMGYFLVVDSFKVSGNFGNHTFESYLILADDAIVNNGSCTMNSCQVAVTAPGIDGHLDIHTLTLGNDVSYRTEEFDGHKRLIIKSANMQREEFLVAFSPHNGNDNNFNIERMQNGIIKTTYDGLEKYFMVNPVHHDLILVDEPLAPQSPSPEYSSSPSTSPTGSQTFSPKPIASQSAEPSMQVIPTSTPSPESSPRVSSSARTSPSSSPSPEASSITTPPEITPYQSSSPNPKWSISATPTPKSAPMKPIRVSGKEVQRILPAMMSKDRSTFLHDKDVRLQIVFRIVARSPNRNKKRGDRFRTCYKRRTTIPTEMAIYDCGHNAVADENYVRRLCSLVKESGDKDKCNTFRSDFRLRLKKNRAYFLAVSVPRGTGDDPRFWLQHGLGQLLQ